MAKSYVPMLLLFAVAIVNAVMMVMMSHMLSPRRPTPQKDMPYESGMILFGETPQRLSVQFHLYAILCIVFDVETTFPIPWAAIYRDIGAFGFIEGLPTWWR